MKFLRTIFALYAITIATGASAQKIGNPGTTLQVLGSLQVDSNVLLKKLATSDSDKVIGVMPDGRLVLRTKGNGSGGGSGSVSSVGFAAPSAFSVSGSPVTGAGTITLSMPGLASQYLRGNGTLATFPTALSAFINDLPAYSETDPTVPSYVKGITSTNISNWNSGYGWGNHALAGYLTQSAGDSRYPLLSGSYSNPNWLNSLAVGKVTGLAQVALDNSYTSLDDLPILGTASQLNVANTGNASTIQAVRGDDTRLSDARTPTAHSHAAGDITSGTFAAARYGSLTIPPGAISQGGATSGQVLAWNGSAYAPATVSGGGGGGVSGSGTTNYLPKWTGSTALGNSVLYETGTGIGVGTTSPTGKLDVAGTGLVRGQLTVQSPTANSPFVFGVPLEAPSYNALSLNGSLNVNYVQGFFGGGAGDPNLYFQGGGRTIFRQAGQNTEFLIGVSGGIYVGQGINDPATTLDVGGAATVRGYLDLPDVGIAPAAPATGCRIYSISGHTYIICAGESSATLIH